MWLPKLPKPADRKTITRLEWRFQRHRRRMLKRGDRLLRRGRFDDAYAAFDWAIVGRQDRPEMLARTCAAIALRQLGDDQEAEERWQAARSQDPHAIIARAAIASASHRYRLPRGLPGDEPVDPKGATDLFVREGGLIDE